MDKMKTKVVQLLKEYDEPNYLLLKEEDLN